MKLPIIPTIFVVVLPISFWGCSTPQGVKQLAEENGRAASRMAEAHRQDLRTLAEYDRQRVVQFHRLLRDYLSLRDQVVTSLNKALDQSKAAAINELDRDFEEQADRLMTSLFWVEYRKEVGAELGRQITRQRDTADARAAAASTYSRDIEAEKQALVAARRRYEVAALAYETVESSFAEMVIKINKAKLDFHAANVRVFTGIRPIVAPALPNGVQTISLPNNTAAITQRIEDLQNANALLEKGNAEIVRYLNENNPGSDFVLAVAGGLIGTDISAILGRNAVPANPDDPTQPNPPDLGDLLTAFDNTLASVGNSASTEKTRIPGLIDTLLSQVRPVAKIINSSAPVLPGEAVAEPKLSKP